MSGQDSDIEILEVAMILIANLITGIYILAILNFWPSWKTGKNLKDFLKKGRKKGGKEEKRKK